MNGGSEDQPWAVNEKSRKAYALSPKGLYIDGEFMGGPAVEEEELLEDGKYLHLKIDLSKRTEQIEEELEYVVKVFKSIVYDSSSSTSEGTAPLKSSPKQGTVTN